MIEFRAHAARPHTKLKREFTVPVDSPDAKLRIAVRGIGQLAISHTGLTDGVSRLVADQPQKKHILGRPAPKSGLPDSVGANRAWAPRFSRPQRPGAPP